VKELAEGIAIWLEDYAEAAGADGYIVGLSGGVDSATAAALAVRGVGKDRVCGLIMPVKSKFADYVDAKVVAEWLGIDYSWIDLGYALDCFLSCNRIVKDGKYLTYADLAVANTKPRLRMATLYLHANTHNYLVLGTGNRSELEIGYFTKYGDGGVDVLPLGDLYKTEVWELARYLGVPQEIIDRPPSAGLWEGQTDEEEIGMSYQELDAELQKLTVHNSRIDHRVAALLKANNHKLHMPPIYRRERNV
jgi:NAD+ synthase